MHKMETQEILKKYYQRFNKSISTNKINKFYTDAASDWIEELPYVMDIENFCLRLVIALQKQEKICIYSDYDADAVSASTVMYWGLVWAGFESRNITIYAPDRFGESYGVNMEAIKKISKKSSLIITVDCGISAIAETKWLRENTKTDILITDHHQLASELPQATARINPQINNILDYKSIIQYSDNQFEILQKHINLAKATDLHRRFIGRRDTENTSRSNLLPESTVGVGVAWFCMIWFYNYARAVGFELDPKKLNLLLPFVAIGTVADCQSVLEPSNRILIKTGLYIMNQSKVTNPGLQVLMDKLGFTAKIVEDYKLTSQDLGFIFGPIFNAPGRISHANLAIGTFTSQPTSQNVDKLIDLNRERKELVASYFGEVEDEVLKQIETGAKFIFIQGEWNKGVVGLLASRIVNQYNLPVGVISVDSEVAAGSLRAPDGYNLIEAMNFADKYFIKYGGHNGAAGLTAQVSKLATISNILSKKLIGQNKRQKPLTNYNILPKEKYLPKAMANILNQKNVIWLDISDINQELLKSVWQMDPFGQDFPLPLLLFAFEACDYRLIGNKSQHISLFLNSNKVTGFNIAEEVVQAITDSESKIWVLAKPSVNFFNSKNYYELIIEKYWIYDKK